MKRLAWLLALAALAPLAASAQTMRFFYVAPAADVDAQFPGQGQTADFLPGGYKAVFLDAAATAAFNSNAPPTIKRTFAELQTGQPLRTFIDRMSGISTRQCDVSWFLTDDRTGIPDGNTGGFAPVARASGGTTTHFVWPNANAWWPDGTTRLRGAVRVGEHEGAAFVASEGWGGWEEVLAHEYLHTQYAPEAFCERPSDNPLGDRILQFCREGAAAGSPSGCPDGYTCSARKDKWGSISVTYGADGAHWVYEMMGDQNLAFEEGLGTFYGSVRNDPASADNIRAFFGRTDERYYLEDQSALRSSPGLESAPRTHRDADPEGSNPRRPARHTYTWRNVPGFYLLFSEITTTAYHSYFWKTVHNSTDQALLLIDQSSQAMWNIRRKRDLFYAANRLALAMEASSPARTPTSSMFAYALLDLLTHFGMSETQFKQEHDRNYPDQNPRAYTEYWNHRAAVQALVADHLAADPIRMDQAVIAVNNYFQDASRILRAGSGG
jgi:hypothetical protein